MKKIMTILCVVFIVSCTKNLESLNKDIKHVTSAAPETFFTSGVKNLTDLMSTIQRDENTWRLLAQYLTENVYLERTNYYIASDGIPDNVWNILFIDVLKNLDESAKTISEMSESIDPVIMIERSNQTAVIEIMKVFTYSVLVETYGDVPYKDALDFENVLPKYDDAKTIYIDLIDRLDKAIISLDNSKGSFGKADLLYNGNTNNWIKFGNSLKLKMGLLIIDIDPTLGAKAVKSSLPNIFNSNADNASVKYLSSSPNLNPMWYTLVQEKREYFVSTKNFVDLLNSLNDPRREIYLSKVNNGFIGAEYGIPASYSSYSHLGSIFYDPTLPGILLDYSSIEFLLAEAAERSIIPGGSAQAEIHYNNAIEASFDYYKVLGASEYLSQPLVSYSTANGNWKQKIGEQKWIALYNQGFYAWTEYRRLDFPILIPGPKALVKSVPTRFTYPISEQSLNGDNYENGSKSVGGDLLTTKLFWDIY